MFDRDKWQEVWQTLRRNKLRTLMTASGVFWGLFMLVLMLGFGTGLEGGVRKNLLGFANNAVFVWAQRTRLAYHGFQAGRRVRFETADIARLQQELPEIADLAPRIQLGGYRDGANVNFKEKTGNFTIMGDFPQVRKVEGIAITSGRFINELDIREKRKIAIIGTDVQRILFGKTKPIGEYIKINKVYFKVVGTFKRDGGNGDQAEQLKSTIYLPFSTFQYAFNQVNRVGWFAMTLKPDADAKVVEKKARALLARVHQIHPNDDQGLGSYNSAEEFGRISNLFTGISFFIWFVGVVTLLAGMLGVSNIMLITVRERTREFGIRKALGATPFSIISLVIQEAVTLTAIAGYAGLVCSVAVLELAGRLIGDQAEAFSSPSVDFRIALIAVAILTIAGLFAGIMPAQRAARINPVLALKAE
ncbi:MAG: ABC transporter permease [Polyangiaceae bacterium]|nr:ABC transporter permease [Polyangiaceae bacterium]